YAAVGYAIVRHDLFDIDAIVKQTAVYTILTAGITAAYATSLLVLGWFLPPQVASTSAIFNIAFVVLVAILFEPLRLRVQHIVDRTFYRARVDYRGTVREVSAALTSLLDLDEILMRVGRTVTEGLAPRSLAIVLWLGAGPRIWRVRKDGAGLTEEE